MKQSGYTTYEYFHGKPTRRWKDWKIDNTILYSIEKEHTHIDVERGEIIPALDVHNKLRDINLIRNYKSASIFQVSQRQVREGRAMITIVLSCLLEDLTSVLFERKNTSLIRYDNYNTDHASSYSYSNALCHTLVIILTNILCKGIAMSI